MITVDMTLIFQIVILILVVFSVSIVFARFPSIKEKRSLEDDTRKINKQAETNLKNIYINLRGRLTLKEYWTYWNIPFFLIVIVLLILENKGIKVNPKLMSTINLLIIWPLIATTVKRLHDLNKSGWLFLLHLLPFIGSIVLSIFLWFVPGTKEANQYD